MQGRKVQEERGFRLPDIFHSFLERVCVLARVVQQVPQSGLCFLSLMPTLLFTSLLTSEISFFLMSTCQDLILSTDGVIPSVPCCGPCSPLSRLLPSLKPSALPWLCSFLSTPPTAGLMPGRPLISPCWLQSVCSRWKTTSLWRNSICESLKLSYGVPPREKEKCDIQEKNG